MRYAQVSYMDTQAETLWNGDPVVLSREVGTIYWGVTNTDEAIRRFRAEHPDNGAPIMVKLYR